MQSVHRDIDKSEWANDPVPVKRKQPVKKKASKFNRRQQRKPRDCLCCEWKLEEDML